MWAVEFRRKDGGVIMADAKDDERGDVAHHGRKGLLAQALTTHHFSKQPTEAGAG
jgi:hypothetical protein